MGRVDLTKLGFQKKTAPSDGGSSGSSPSRTSPSGQRSIMTFFQPKQGQSRPASTPPPSSDPAATAVAPSAMRVDVDAAATPKVAREKRRVHEIGSDSDKDNDDDDDTEHGSSVPRGPSDSTHGKRKALRQDFASEDEEPDNTALFPSEFSGKQQQPSRESIAIHDSSDEHESDANEESRSSRARARLHSFMRGGSPQSTPASTTTATAAKQILSSSLSSRSPDATAAPAAALIEKSGQLESRTLEQSRKLFRERIGGTAPSSKGSKAKSPYTQLEQQYIDIKCQHPDAVLFVECGYKFKFFGEDAEIAAKELSIVAYPSHNFMNASIPTNRLPVHVKRLVNRGYKVGVVRQTETAAIKAASDSKSAPFERKLTGLYTKATLVGDDIESLDDDSSQQTGSSHYLMCIFEEDASDESTSLAVVAIRPSTGDIIYDEFPDTVSRAELETRIAHIQPSELVLPLTLSSRTNQLLASIVSSEEIRTERVEDRHFEYEGAFRAISAHFKRRDGAEEPPSSGNPAPQQGPLHSILNLSPRLIRCFGALLVYLADFGLDRVLQLTNNFSKFRNQQCMLLSASAISNLELFANETNGSTDGSLFALIDHAVTPFGRRLLRKWLAQPLLQKELILERQEAVAELVSKEAGFFEKTRKMLQSVGDLDKGLCRIYYRKCSPSEFLVVLHAFNRTANVFLHWKPANVLSASSSSLLTVDPLALRSKLLLEISSLNVGILNTISDFLSRINSKAAKEKTKANLFSPLSEPAKLVRLKKSIVSIEAQLQTHLAEARRTLGLPSLEYISVLTEEYLFDVKRAALDRVPKDWLKINVTKASVRYRSPFVIETLRELNRAREELELAAEQEWTSLLSDFGGAHYDEFRNVVSHLATLDCLFALAQVAKQDRYVRPDIVDGDAMVDIKQGRHPMVDSFLSGQFVPNDAFLKQSEHRCRIITGPNMGGKSCYIRQVALLVILAQIGSWVPAESARIGIVDGIHTRMGAADNIQRGSSTFMVEMQETSKILKNATSKSLVILDELGRGTSTFDGLAIAHATLDYLITEIQCLTLFVTHYPALGQFSETYPGLVSNHHMSFFDDAENQQSRQSDSSMHLGEGSEDDTKVQSIAFLYQLVDGVSLRSYGLNVARLAGIPATVIRVAFGKSVEMEQKVKSRGASSR